MLKSRVQLKAKKSKAPKRVVLKASYKARVDETKYDELFKDGEVNYFEKENPSSYTVNTFNRHLDAFLALNSRARDLWRHDPQIKRKLYKDVKKEFEDYVEYRNLIKREKEAELSKEVPKAIKDVITKVNNAIIKIYDEVKKVVAKFTALDKDIDKVYATAINRAEIDDAVQKSRQLKADFTKELEAYLTVMRRENEKLNKAEQLDLTDKYKSLVEDSKQRMLHLVGYIDSINTYLDNTLEKNRNEATKRVEVIEATEKARQDEIEKLRLEAARKKAEDEQKKKEEAQRKLEEAQRQKAEEQRKREEEQRKKKAAKELEDNLQYLYEKLGDIEQLISELSDYATEIQDQYDKSTQRIDDEIALTSMGVVTKAKREHEDVLRAQRRLLEKDYTNKANQAQTSLKQLQGTKVQIEEEYKKLSGRDISTHIPAAQGNGLQRRKAQRLKKGRGRRVKVGKSRDFFFEGQGILGDIAKRVKNVFTNTYSPDTEKALKKYADYQIEECVIWRVPVQSYLQKFLGAITFGEFQKNIYANGFDSVYHLYINMKLMNPSSGDVKYVSTEKIPNIRFNERKDLKEERKGAEPVMFVLTSPVMFKDVIEEAMRVLGPNYHRYTTDLWNCQSYILTLVDAMFKLDGQSTPAEIRNFIYQDPKLLFANLGKTAKLSNAITSIGHFFGRIVGHGRKLSKHKQKQLVYAVNAINQMHGAGFLDSISKYANKGVDLYNQHKDKVEKAINFIKDNKTLIKSGLKILDNATGLPLDKYVSPLIQKLEAEKLHQLVNKVKKGGSVSSVLKLAQSGLYEIPEVGPVIRLIAENAESIVNKLFGIKSRLLPSAQAKLAGVDLYEWDREFSPEELQYFGYDWITPEDQELFKQYRDKFIKDGYVPNYNKKYTQWLKDVGILGKNETTDQALQNGNPDYKRFNSVIGALTNAHEEIGNINSKLYQARLKGEA